MGTKAMVESSGEVVPVIDRMSIIQTAVEKGADVATLEKLLDLQNRWEAGEARKAFVRAMNLFREKVPIIVKDNPVSFGQTNYKHATLSKAIETIKPVLKECELSHGWKTSNPEKDIVKVICEVKHVDGHIEQTELSAGHDSSGGKNAIQAIGSTVSYLQRYTLFSILGLASAEDDDAIEPPELITDKQAEEIQKLLTDRNADMERFKSWLIARDVPSGEIKDIRTSLYAVVVKRIKKNDEVGK